MSDAESVVTDLLIGIARADAVLREAHEHLTRDPAWSAVSYALRPGEFNTDRGDPNARVALSGSLRGRLAGLGEVVWQIEVFRSSDGAWAVDRWVNTWRPDEDVPGLAEVHDVTCRTSAELASELPGLVRELVTLAPTSPV